jgi:hypothetical protein
LRPRAAFSLLPVLGVAWLRLRASGRCGLGRKPPSDPSRFVEIINQYRLNLSLKKISDILAEMKTHLNAASSHIEINFPYFIEKHAPVSAPPV